MDTSELLLRGARSKIVDLCKEIEEIVKVVPGLKSFAIGMVRETLGFARQGRPPALNGDGRERLADQLVVARQRRLTERAKKASAGRKPPTEAQLAVMRTIGKKRWALARKLGYTGRTLPTNAVIAELKAKAANSKQKANDGPSTAP